MLTSNWFATVMNNVTAIVCCAILLLFLSQLRRDSKSRSFARLIALLSSIGFANVIVREMVISGVNNIDNMFMILTVQDACLPYFLFTFTMDYFEDWTPWKHRLARALIAVVTILYAVLLIVHYPFILKNTHISPDGLMLYEYGPFSGLYGVLIGLAELGVVLSIWTAIQQYRRQRSRINQLLMIGILVLVTGMFIIPIPGIERYAFEQIFYAVGSVILVPPILRQRLFEPLSQLYASVKHQTEQLALIARVGQKATSVLALNTLLQGVARDIHQSFGHDSLTICLLNEKGEVTMRAATEGVSSIPPKEPVLTPVPDKLVYLSDVRKACPFRIHLLQPDIRSAVSIPLTVISGDRTEPTVIGMLSIQDKNVDAFTENDREVLQILARQIAIAIHNAELFEATQRANQAKTKFVSYISHEIRNAVSSISALTGMILNHPEVYELTALPEALKKDIEEIDQAAHHLTKLVSDVLDLAKIEAGQMEMTIRRTDPTSILRRVRQYAEGLLQPGVVFHARHADMLPAVLADDMHLDQILTNLVGNALKFTKQGHIAVDAQPEDGMLRFSVADTGPGISQELLTRLFNAYTQGSREITQEYGGTGLSLNISKQFVELHGGRIWADSELGKGTTFHFTIPLSSDGA